MHYEQEEQGSLWGGECVWGGSLDGEFNFGFKLLPFPSFRATTVVIFKLLQKFRKHLMFLAPLHAIYSKWNKFNKRERKREAQI